MKSWMQQARETTGLTTIECAKALLLSEKGYLIKENNPGMLTIDELVALNPLLADFKAVKNHRAWCCEQNV